jgi:hypothetical protein
MKVESIEQVENGAYKVSIVPDGWWDRFWNRKSYSRTFFDEGFTYMISGKIAWRDENGFKVSPNWITDALESHIFRTKRGL